jgi:hypothetical protein
LARLQVRPNVPVSGGSKKGRLPGSGINQARRSSGNLKKNLGKFVEIWGNMGKMRFQTNGVTVKPTKSWINKT